MTAVARVLVLDGDMVPALTIARSLARRGAVVHIAGHTERPLSSYSRHCTLYWRCPNPLEAESDYLGWLDQHCSTEAYDLVIPVTERTLVPLSRQRADFDDVPLVMPAADSLDLVLDKSQTMALAEQVGVCVPQGVRVDSLAQLEAVADGLHFPVVLKPERSIGSGAAGVSQLQVSYAFDHAELRAGCTHALRFGAVLLQEYFAGQGVGVELIADRGNIAYSFQHRRLHEVPLTGGGSSLRVSEPVNAILLEASRKLIEALNWHGVAMVEFKFDPATGDYRLMEINGRFWGSLPLAAAAGADFPGMLFELERDGAVGTTTPYRNGVLCRLLSRDVSWYEAVLRGAAPARIVTLPTRGEVLRGLAQFFSPRHRYDVQSLSDPLPGLVDLGRIVGSYAARLGTLLRERRFLAAQRHGWRAGAVGRQLAGARRLLFVCYGNINRSALADILVRPYAEDSGYTVVSAGFHEEGGREMDPVMRSLVEAEGLSVDGFGSTVLTMDMLADSDLVFVMEQRHYDRIVAMDPRAGERTFLLGAHENTEGWPAEIPDPYGCPRDQYMACYRRIAGAVDRLKSLMASDDGSAV